MSHARPLPPGMLEPEGVAPLRRYPVSPRRRTSRALYWLRRIGAPVLLLLASLGLGAWMLGSPHFALAEVEVRDTGEAGSAGWVDPAQVRQQMLSLRGRNLFLLSLSEVKARLANPWVAEISVVKELPDRLLVTVVERQPAALVPWRERLWWADRGGCLVAPVHSGAGTARRPKGLPVVQGGEIRLCEGCPGECLPPLPAAMETLGELAAAEPHWAAQTRNITILGDEDFVLETTALPFPLKVRAGTVTAVSRQLAVLLPELSRRYGSSIETVDLRFSRRIVLKVPAHHG